MFQVFFECFTVDEVVDEDIRICPTIAHVPTAENPPIVNPTINNSHVSIHSPNPHIVHIHNTIPVLVITTTLDAILTLHTPDLVSIPTHDTPVVYNDIPTFLILVHPTTNTLVIYITNIPTPNTTLTLLQDYDPKKKYINAVHHHTQTAPDASFAENLHISLQTVPSNGSINPKKSTPWNRI